MYLQDNLMSQNQFNSVHCAEKKDAEAVWSVWADIVWGPLFFPCIGQTNKMIRSMYALN